MFYRLERPIGRQKLVFETGKLASQANGSGTLRYGDTMVLVTAVISAQIRPDIDFLPLTVDFEERLYAVGKIPGSFFRREGRPGQEAILSGRLTDRPLRPLFPKGLRNDVQIVITVLSADQVNPPDILGIIGASAAVGLSEIPWEGPVGATRVAYRNGEYLINPTYAEIAESTLSVVVAGTRDAIVMIEAGGNEAPEATVLEAIRQAQAANQEVIALIDDLVKAVGRPKLTPPPVASTEGIERSVHQGLNGRLAQLLEENGSKAEREAAIDRLGVEVQQRLAEQYEARDIKNAFQSILKDLVRTRILEKGLRPDGRTLAEVRPITCEVGVVPRTHGSGLFTRGQTQVLTTATLASMGMEQRLDTLNPEDSKRFIHHYNFPPYSTGETGRLGGPGRREVGHGALAEKALFSVVPKEEVFPYAIRLVSEVLSSNGSTSMASVCAGSLALMDAGVPITTPVAGVAMGLVMGEGGRYAVLTDIQGIEDNLGDMDFKVAGTAKGINALQLDVKVKGLTTSILERALEQARVGRLLVLDKMKAAIVAPRESLSPYAPKMLRMVIPVEKIGTVIGGGGRTIRGIIEETGATIDIDDKGTVLIGATDEAKIEKARLRIENLTRDLVVGDVFTGKVVRLATFGAFVELVAGKDGLLRSSEMGDMENGLKVGQEITVMVQEIDSMGRINLSRRALFGDQPGGGAPPRPSRPTSGPRRTGGPPGGAGQGEYRPPPSRDAGFRRRPGP